MTKFRVTKKLTFCAGHRLFKYKGACANIHGHNYKVYITFERDGLNDLGMVTDFGHITAKVGAWIERVLDHALILHAEDTLIPLINDWEEGLIKTLPPLKLCVMPCNPTAENLCDYIKLGAEAAMGDFEPIRVSRVVVYETDTAYAEVIK